MATRFASTFPSTDGLEEFERDDIEEAVEGMLQTIHQIEKKKSKGRATKPEEKSVERGALSVLKIVEKWAKRPKPSTPSRPLHLSDTARLFIREGMLLLDETDPATLESDDFGSELLDLVVDIAESVGVKIKPPHLDQDKMDEDAVTDEEYDPFWSTAYEPIGHSLQDIVNWDESAQEMAEKMADGGESTDDDEEDEGELEELNWEYEDDDDEVELEDLDRASGFERAQPTWPHAGQAISS
ncbi:hypothetical protein VE02_06280 [Pseudogymnoascus sp. 03VT05]|nr:hypothetical protein VE02_06280 [Pseudogymnoascus sp. 03VT05]